MSGKSDTEMYKLNFKKYLESKLDIKTHLYLFLLKS